MKSATTFLMFQGQANEAIQQYQQWFSELQVESLTYMENSQQVAMAVLHLKGLKMMVNDSVIQHNFTFTPSTSIFVECESEEEIDSLVAQILEGGQALMPLDNYGFSKKFAWIQDRFGVSWQLTYN
ncbi:VOC family protein [Lysinibacillus agricola]|jgi:predicted 3-demethylubiquinone-9 3-methyltransferase (glyoxalase superfamily)|uniref:VOC family protein n=1 Tax=Lysinibacillus agricola TaxID=2590012 RepID=A0ABX7ARN3_9BACI|nr:MULTISPECIES: VOC family protein [Lysinibacillus]KOS63244.1 PhnB protein [Lysinibacillus sp. FJAT-14222]QQP12187.1 VOC family protein [Lysinibacillus agricola]